MTRYQILVVASGTAANVGTTCLIQSRGRIKAVQFSLAPNPDLGSLPLGNIVSVSKSAAYINPTPTNGTNPTEIASTVVTAIGTDTATSSVLAVNNGDSVVPCDMPVSEGEQIFVATAALGSFNAMTSTDGLITLFVE